MSMTHRFMYCKCPSSGDGGKDGWSVLSTYSAVVRNKCGSVDKTQHSDGHGSTWSLDFAVVSLWIQYSVMGSILVTGQNATGALQSIHLHLGEPRGTFTEEVRFEQDFCMSKNACIGRWWWGLDGIQRQGNLVVWQDTLVSRKTSSFGEMYGGSYWIKKGRWKRWCSREIYSLLPKCTSCNCWIYYHIKV